jgi:DNA-binding NtrC family response regulator
MTKKSNILFADDEATFRTIMSNELTRMGYKVTCCPNGVEALRIVQERDFDVVLLDMNMPEMDGIETLKKIKEIETTTEVIILTGKGTIENAVQAIKLGAYDYLTKPCRLSELDALLQKALEKRQLRKENVYLKRLIKEDRASTVMIGNGEAIKSLYKTIDKVAPSDAIVLIQGESGTGKELVANIIHQHSNRASMPFVVINCATLQETLLESELFGHTKGAFTGATESRMGLFEAADGGTLFLDEIGELTVNTQAKLLRVIQSGETRRIGDNRVVTVDARIIAATNKNLAAEAKKGSFRDDLYFRLNVIALFLPPLRERKDDIPTLIRHFLTHFCRNKREKRLLPEALEAMTLYDWPGNVRELKNTVERMVVLSEGDTISPEDLPENIRGTSVRFDATEKSDSSLAGMERRHIMKILQEKQGNKTVAAETLGISLKTLYNKSKYYRIDN